MTNEKQKVIAVFHAKLGNLIMNELYGKVTPDDVDEFYGLKPCDSIIGALFRRAEQIKQALDKSKTG